MQITKYIALYLLPILFTYCQEIRNITFTTYGQYRVQDVEYNPVAPEALAAGLESPSPISIATHTLERMGPYEFTGLNTIKFYESGTDSIVARVNIPTSVNKWLLVFLKNPNYKTDPDNNLKYLVYPFDDSLKNLPNNGLVFLNISGKELSGLIEQNRVTLAMGESGSYRVQESIPINLWARNFDGSKLLPVLVKTYKFKFDHRYLMIFFPPVLSSSPDLDVRLLVESAK